MATTTPKKRRTEHQIGKKCNGTNRKTGQPCGNYPLKGQTVCRYHGGNTPNAKAKAPKARQMAEIRRELQRLGSPAGVKGDPAQILLALVREKAAEVGWLRIQVEALEDDTLWRGVTKATTEENAFGGKTSETVEARQHIVYTMYHKAQDQLAAYTAAALKAGIEERQVRIAEETAGQFTAILSRLRSQLDLTDSQAGQWDTVVSTVVREALDA